MKSGQIFLLVIAALIFGFLISKLVRRIRIKKTINNINTTTQTTTDTSSSSSERKSGCVPPIINYGELSCPNGKTLKRNVGTIITYQCC